MRFLDIKKMRVIFGREICLFLIVWECGKIRIPPLQPAIFPNLSFLRELTPPTFERLIGSRIILL
jgi:hypothetical protein